MVAATLPAPLAAKLTDDERRERQRAASRAWKDRNRDKARAARRRWAQANPAKVRENKRRWRERHPERARAHDLLQKAKARHGLTAEPCAVCQAVPTEAHHDDYSQPLEVRWLCKQHHEEIHHG